MLQELSLVQLAENRPTSYGTPSQSHHRTYCPETDQFNTKSQVWYRINFNTL